MQNRTQVNVDLSDGKKSQTISLIGDVSLKDVANAVLSLAQPVETPIDDFFAGRDDAIISVPTSHYSDWVEAIEFQPSAGVLTFVVQNDGGNIQFLAEFSDFEAAANAESAGEYFHRVAKKTLTRA